MSSRSRSSRGIYGLSLSLLSAFSGLVHGAGTAGAVINAPAAPGEVAEPSGPAPGSITAPRGKKIVIDGVNKALTATCRDGAIEIGGTGHTVRLRGNCTVIIVEGTGHTVSANSAVCNGASVRVAGTSNLLKLQGNCASVRVEGMGNSVVGMQVGSVQLSGDSNSVGWRDDAGNSKPPEVSSAGAGNRVYPLR